MPRAAAPYRCDACGAEAPRWTGRCPACGAWNTLTEKQGILPARRSGKSRPTESAQLLALQEIGGAHQDRRSSGIPELDRVLGGGLVNGSVVLVGGDPGIGKSTLVLQAAALLAQDEPVVYVSGEESPEQVAARSRRLGLKGERLFLVAETHLETILPLIEQARPRLAVIDSIQTIYSDLTESPPGSATQLRESTAALVRMAKKTGICFFIIGHVTKEGAIAGPRVLEHLVDTVLYFENDAGSRYRLIRSVKNRFGSANELGVFVMTDTGLREVRNPSAIFLSNRLESVSGSVVAVIREGNRPLLVEVQALVDETPIVPPRRITVGSDSQRLILLLAIFNRHGGHSVSGRDVFVNIAGGLRVSETAIDLPLLLAVWSNLVNQPLPRDLVAFGEVGLNGEIRPVFGGEERLQEAWKHGFRKALVPKGNLPRSGRVVHAGFRAVENFAACISALTGDPRFRSNPDKPVQPD